MKARLFHGYGNNIYSFKVMENRQRQSAEDCAICLDRIQGKKTLKCSHSFCSECLESSFKRKPACPVCNTFYGTHTGNQPEGTMTVTRSQQRLPGYERCGSIVIHYIFPAGIQGSEHPNPGVRYSGTSRIAFLPACEEGEKVLKLLKKAFDRKLIFTVGRSVTTGLNNVITWNDIHHKTRMDGGPQSFGYPDPQYLSRVQEELRLKGVTEEN
ncbi:probable E3 ubiquitin-protein ligase DTX3 [Takifugu rubripes]|uniref:probable E3 ubiquitin-protein ligase DTX3 n=1 Tax=Takifugu rubripes TaxID=31033 RepID=UPI000298AFD1|nr:probable E3 ubiquitin-protein ligase DTX3 [Takifugu rubripes]XP_029690387.1 probable E3 ubiquitin-protein ligase DTX3 [Takifugu rubripes]